MTEYETIAAVTAVVAIFSATWIALQIAKSNRFNPAATEFVSAFSTAIQTLNDGESDTFVLQEQFPIHKEAMRRFVLNLSGSTERRFRETWQRYENLYKSRTGDDAMIQHAMAVLNAKDIGTAKLNSHALALIEELLQFARYNQ